MIIPVDKSASLIYDKYAPAIFGYILSIIKNKSQAEEILIKTFIHLAIINPKEEKMLIEGIRAANRAILEITKKERKFLLKVFEN